MGPLMLEPPMRYAAQGVLRFRMSAQVAQDRSGDTLDLGFILILAHATSSPRGSPTAVIALQEHE